MYPNYLLPLLALLLPMGAVSAAPATAAEEPAYQPLAAHYQEIRSASEERTEVADWYLTRRDRQVETARGDYAEVWQRDARGELTLTRVFHQDRKVIQYTPGELRTQRRSKDWAGLNGFFDPRQMATLKKVGTEPVLGRPASHYIGKLGKEEIEVVWLDQEALLAKYARSGRDGSIVYELKELRLAPATGWLQDSLNRAEHYAFLDGADLGDMEYDPFVQRVLGLDDEHGSHVHHNH